jgi:hypothetical protein
VDYRGNKVVITQPFGFINEPEKKSAGRPPTPTPTPIRRRRLSREKRINVKQNATGLPLSVASIDTAIEELDNLTYRKTKA